MLSVDLLNLYSEIIMRTMLAISGISVGGHSANSMRYAGDRVLITENKMQLQEVTHIRAT